MAPEASVEGHLRKAEEARGASLGSCPVERLEEEVALVGEELGPEVDALRWQ
jgi:hypothetical protein